MRRFKRGCIERMEKKYGIAVKLPRKGRIWGAWRTAGAGPPEHISVDCGADFCAAEKFWRLSKDYEALTDTTETWIDIAKYPFSSEETVLIHENGFSNTCLEEDQRHFLYLLS